MRNRPHPPKTEKLKKLKLTKLFLLDSDRLKVFSTMSLSSLFSLTSLVSLYSIIVSTPRGTVRKNRKTDLEKLKNRNKNCQTQQHQGFQAVSGR